jgi:hypothetical protein
MSNGNGSENGQTQAVPDRFQAGWLDNLDGRLGLARELRQRFDALTGDLGGADQLSYQQRSLCERALWLEYWLSQQEQTLAAGGEFNVGQWVQASNSLQGIFSKLGLQRVAKEVPSLAEYAAARAAEKAGATG